MPKRTDVEQAARLIAPYVHRTPVLTSTSLDVRCHARLYFKCENFQKTGAFKARGAMHAMLGLSDATRSVVTHSSGNHGAAVAWAAQECGKSAYVICPIGSVAAKRRAIVRYGGNLIDCGNEIPDREQELERFLNSHHATFIPPYDDPRIISGQGTAALELLEQVPDLDQIWVPVGGGGLVSGTAVAAGSAATVVGAEPYLARDAFESLRLGVLQSAFPPLTCADGLRAPLGRLNYATMQKYETEVVLVTEAEIEAAAKLLWQHLKIVVELSSAVPFAALLKSSERIAGKRIAVIFSGGNHEFE